MRLGDGIDAAGARLGPFWLAVGRAGVKWILSSRISRLKRKGDAQCVAGAGRQPALNGGLSIDVACQVRRRDVLHGRVPLGRADCIVINGSTAVGECTSRHGLSDALKEAVEP